MVTNFVPSGNVASTLKKKKCQVLQENVIEKKINKNAHHHKNNLKNIQKQNSLLEDNIDIIFCLIKAESRGSNLSGLKGIKRRMININ